MFRIKQEQHLEYPVKLVWDCYCQQTSLQVFCLKVGRGTEVNPHSFREELGVLETTVESDREEVKSEAAYSVLLVSSEKCALLMILSNKPGCVFVQ